VTEFFGTVSTFIDSDGLKWEHRIERPPEEDELIGFGSNGEEVKLTSPHWSMVIRRRDVNAFGRSNVDHVGSHVVAGLSNLLPSQVIVRDSEPTNRRSLR